MHQWKSTYMYMTRDPIVLHLLINYNDSNLRLLLTQVLKGKYGFLSRGQTITTYLPALLGQWYSASCQPDLRLTAWRIAASPHFITPTLSYTPALPLTPDTSKIMLHSMYTSGFTRWIPSMFIVPRNNPVI